MSFPPATSFCIDELSSSSSWAVAPANQSPLRISFRSQLFISILGLPLMESKHCWFGAVAEWDGKAIRVGKMLSRHRKVLSKSHASAPDSCFSHLSSSLVTFLTIFSRHIFSNVIIFYWDLSLHPKKKQYHKLLQNFVGNRLIYSSSYERCNDVLVITNNNVNKNDNHQNLIISLHRRISRRISITYNAPSSSLSHHSFFAND